MSSTIRSASAADALSLLKIYKPIVENTTVSFELRVPSVEEFAKRIEKSVGSHAWLVLDDDGMLCGYAYGTEHRAREAYQYSVETSVYVHPEHRQKGVGEKLYSELLNRLAQAGFHRAFAGIALPNASSIAIHSKLGFTEIGVFKEIGYKFNAWHDVSWWQRHL